MNSRRPLLIVLVLLLACFSLTSLITFMAPPLVQAAPTARYVAPGGVDAGNACTVPMTPCASLQHAVRAALPGDEIRVAGGVYSDVHAGMQLTQVLFITQSIAVHGGYPPAFATQPDPDQYPTRLDALGRGRVIVISGPVTVTLSGLQITGGAALTRTANQGGGIYALGARLFLSQTAVFSNRAEFGGGIFGQWVTGTITGSVILSNEARYGGGIYWRAGVLTLTHSHVDRNTAQVSGGAMRLYDSSTHLADDQFAANRSSLSGGGIYASLSSVTLTRSVVSGNVVSSTSQGWGGGLHLHRSEARLVGNVLLTNTAPSGGGLRFLQSDGTLLGNRFQGNQAADGGALSLEAGTAVTLTNQVLLRNTAVSGAACHSRNATSHWLHTTFAGNDGHSALYAGTDTAVYLTNTLFYSHTLGVENEGGQVEMVATLWDATRRRTLGPVTESGVRYGAAALAADGYHLTPASLAIEAGVDAGITTDVDGRQRPFHLRPDVGAVEYVGLIVRKQVTPTLVTPGQVVTYTLRLTNVDAVSLSVMLTDVLPAQVTYSGGLTASSGTAVYAAGVITWTGVLALPDEVQLQWTGVVSETVSPGTTIGNVALIDTGTELFSSNAALIVYPAQVYLPMIRTGGGG